MAANIIGIIETSINTGRKKNLEGEGFRTIKYQIHEEKDSHRLQGGGGSISEVLSRQNIYMVRERRTLAHTFKANQCSCKVNPPASFTFTYNPLQC